MLAVARAEVLFVLDLVNRAAIGVLWKVNQIAAGGDTYGIEPEEMHR